MNEEFKKKLFRNGVLTIDNHINDVSASNLIFDLMTLRDEMPNKTIQLFISCDSLDYYNIMSIYDVIVSLPNPIAGFVIGQVSRFGAILLAACTKGKRYALKHSQIILSQPIGAFDGTVQQTQAVIEANEVGTQRDTYEEILAKHTGQSKEKIHNDLHDGLVLDAEEALAYGIIDHILD